MMISTKKEVTIEELVYLAYFAVMLGAKAIGLYEGQFWYNVCLLIGGALFAVKILITKHSPAEYLLMILLMALGTVIYLQSGEKSLLIFLTMMFGVKNVSLDKVFKTGCVIWLTSFVSMYVLAVIGVIPERAFVLERYGWPPILRHSLGYPHPNTLHVTYFILCLLLLYSLRTLSRKYLIAISVVLMLGNCYVFLYSLSRNGFLISTLFIFLNLYFALREKRSRLEDTLIRLIFPISALVLIIFPLIVKGNTFEILNRIFAGRFVFTRHFLTYEPLKLFGIREIPVPQSHYVIDSSYIYLIFRLGLVAFVLYFIVMLWFVNDLIKNDMRAEMAVVLALTVGGINETYLFNQSFKNFIFLFLGLFMYGKMAAIKAKKPVVIFEEILGFGIGKRMVAIPARDNKSNRKVPVNIWAFSAILLIFVGLITSILYMSVTTTPKDIYLPEEEILPGKAEELYLTEEDIAELKHEGNIIRGYVDENTPMYRVYRKGTVKVEYFRYIISYGLWAGSVVSIGFLLIWTARSKVRFLLRNRQIGSDYKENVLIVHNYYRIPGGEDVVVANEKELLEKNGHKVILYSRNNSEAGDHGFLQKVGLAFVSIFNLRTYREVCSIIERERIDVIQVHNTVALISPAVYLAGINHGIPVIQTIHNFRLVCPNGVCYIRDHVCERCLEHGLKASLLYNCYRDSKLQTFVCALTMKIQRLLQTYRAIYYICLTDFNRQKLLALKQIKEDNIFIKPNFTTIEDKGLSAVDRKRQIVYAGRIEKIKGVDILLQAWMKLGDKAPKLIICGSGELEGWCKEYISNNEIENVEMLGQISNSEVKKLIGESMAMIYPTQWYEGFPMAVAEAYVMGTPIIASDIGNVGNLVDEGISGLKFKSNSVVSLAKAVEKFAESPIVLPEEYMTKYTAEKNYVMLKGIYETVRRRTYE
ncbi:glycosyltransferase family 4 protein [Butyrivibrio sp. FCS006]|uniref:glycosyltransferase family 4 protein n=1 Tax=Butyrivibrio sp. FCS006 TaxID=1280684 RepID=UPI000423A76C|nr:glycosyltransferase family 4 protein [Butyrivibrio sp. FCS006]